MKKNCIQALIALLFFVGVVFFGCSNTETIELGNVSSDSHENNCESDSCDPNDPSDPGDPSNPNGNVNNSSNSNNSGGTSSSSSNQASGTSSSSSNQASGASSSSSNQASGSTSNCAYQTSLCGGIEFEDIIKTSLNGNIEGEGPSCVYATAVSKMGNENGAGDGLRINGIKLVGNGNSNVGGRCGNTTWGQQTCAEAMANVSKIDGGYYIYAPGWAGDFVTTGGTPNCSGGSGGTTPGTSSSSVTSGGGTSSAGSSSSQSSTLTCTSLPTSGTENVSITTPTVRCGTSTVTGSNITWLNAPSWTNPAAGTYNNVQARANSGTCSGQTANCSGTLVVSAATTPSSSSNSQSSNSGSAPNLTDGGYTSTGVSTRYWDSCKPSCAWTGNAQGSNGASKSCSVSGAKLSDANTTSACDNGNAYTCMDQAPWAVNDNVAYGFAASHSNGDCGKCYQIKFTSTSIKDKIMVVMISNIGGDVSGNQFDLMIPGGGVGIFNALSKQISSNGGPSSPSLGAQYGGFRTTCNGDKTCIRNMCSSNFSTSALSNLKAGCDWYIDWFDAADNPSFNLKEITCPSDLLSKYK